MVGKKLDYRIEDLESEPIYLTEIVTSQTEIIQKTSGKLGSFVIRRQKCMRIRVRARSVRRPKQTAPRYRRV